MVAVGFPLLHQMELEPYIARDNQRLQIDLADPAQRLMALNHGCRLRGFRHYERTTSRGDPPGWGPSIAAYLLAQLIDMQVRDSPVVSVMLLTS